jgi:hypothetical protein
MTYLDTTSVVPIQGVEMKLVDIALLLTAAVMALEQ